jgi:hypothetical protein
MPKNRAALKEEQIKLLETWINDGAKKYGAR